MDFDEVHRFLDTWYFFIAENGFLYARPRRTRISRAEMESFTRRLILVCQGGIPNLILIDLSGVQSTQQTWSMCRPLIRRFARLTNAMARFECDRFYAAIVIARRRG